MHTCSVSSFVCHTSVAHMPVHILQQRGHPEQVHGDTLRVSLVAQLDVRLQNSGSPDLRVADFRRWESPIVCPNEVNKVVETEKYFQGACPLMTGARAHFGLARKRFLRRNATKGLVMPHLSQAL